MLLRLSTTHVLDMNGDDIFVGSLFRNKKHEIVEAGYDVGIVTPWKYLDHLKIYMILSIILMNLNTVKKS